MKKRRAGQLMALPMNLWAICFVGVSLLYIIGLSFLKTDGQMGVIMEFTTENYERMLKPAYGKVLLASLELALKTTVLTVALGYPFGYLMARTKPRTRTILMLLIIVPFWTNALIRIYGWKILLNASGPINNVLKALGIIDRPLKLLNTEGSVLLGMVYAMLPFMILPSYTAVEKMDWTVVEAARDLGANRVRAFLTTTLPLTLSGMMAGCVLVFIPSVGLFFLSDLLGGAKTSLAGNLINDAYKRSRDLPFAAALSVVLLAVTGLIIAVYRRLGGKSADLGLF